MHNSAKIDFSLFLFDNSILALFDQCLLIKTELIPKTVIEGGCVPLDTRRPELQRDDVVEWRFKGNVIAKISRAANKIYQKTYDGADGRFRNRLELDGKTGSLTITNTRTTDSGEYQLQIASNGNVESYRFNVSVFGE